MDTLLPLAQRVGEKLKARKETVGISESSAGGLISAALLAVPGASAYFLGGSVVYTRAAREALLGIPTAALKAAAPASAEMAALLAEGMRSRLGTDWALGEAGAAGPTGNSYGHAAGHGVFAVAGPVAKRLTIETGDADRAANMRAFGRELLLLLLAALEAAPQK